MITDIGGYLYQWWPMATDPLKYMIPIGTSGHQATDPLKYMIPIGTNGHQATVGDQW